MIDRSYVVMDRICGNTLNELSYSNPKTLDDNYVTIAYQLGMHLAFSYVFGSKDGYQTNYIFDPTTRLLTRIDKESFLDLPQNPENNFEDENVYTQEIAACELSNLRYIPRFKNPKCHRNIILAIRQGFLDKYGDIKLKKRDLLQMVMDTRMTWLRMDPPDDIEAYAADTLRIFHNIEKLISQDPERVFERLKKAKKEFDKSGI